MAVVLQTSLVTDSLFELPPLETLWAFFVNRLSSRLQSNIEHNPLPCLILFLVCLKLAVPRIHFNFKLRDMSRLFMDNSSIKGTELFWKIQLFCKMMRNVDERKLFLVHW